MAEKEFSLQAPSHQAGAAPVDGKEVSRPPNAKQVNSGLHWFAHGANDFEVESNDYEVRRRTDTHNGSSLVEDEDNYLIDQGKDSQIRDREERLRVLREKQNEERQRKLDELKQQALAAQKFREQKEEERRKRLEEFRIRDHDKRHQVEERKRQIWEAERDRREAILRKNQEREARIESKRKNERSSIVFAFGSSTPRMLEPGDSGSSYWNNRRATSTTNVMSLSLAAPGPLTRRSSERELDGSKKRATSAGAERKLSQDENDGSAVGSVRLGRRKTDLTPTIPSPREATGSARGKKSSPGRAYSMSRLDILAQPRRPRVQATSAEASPPNPELSRSMSTLPGSQKPLGKTNKSKSMLQLGGAPVPPPRPTRAEKLRRLAREAQQGSQSVDQPSNSSSPGLRSGEMTPSRPTSSMSQHSVASNLSTASANLRSRPNPRRPRPFSIAVTGVSDRMSLSAEFRSSKSASTEKPPIPKPALKKQPSTTKPEQPKTPIEKLKHTKSSGGTTKTSPAQSPALEVQVEKEVVINEIKTENSTSVVIDSLTLTKIDNEEEIVIQETVITTKEEHKTTPKPRGAQTSPTQPATKSSEPQESEKTQAETLLDLSEADMNTSVNGKNRITTEEEAKAALAERRRQAREQAEREAELERQRLEAERLAEEERLRKEEEDQKRMEEEQLRLLEEARKSEELRLQQAIEEAKKREEEERKRKEEELKLKIEKEESERKAKEEAEKLRQEMELRLKKEEEDRQARRKRVEAIMLRTRGKGNASTTTPTKDGEETEESPLDETKAENSVKSQNDEFLNSERTHGEANPDNLINLKQNGHHNGSVHAIAHHNVTNSLLDLTPVSTETVEEILDHPPSGNGKINETALQTIQPPFIPFQEKKEPPTVNDLLS